VADGAVADGAVAAVLVAALAGLLAVVTAANEPRTAAIATSPVTMIFLK
jgi:hypothetical protein